MRHTAHCDAGTVIIPGGTHRGAARAVDWCLAEPLEAVEAVAGVELGEERSAECRLHYQHIWESKFRALGVFST